MCAYVLCVQLHLGRSACLHVCMCVFWYDVHPCMHCQRAQDASRKQPQPVCTMWCLPPTEALLECTEEAIWGIDTRATIQTCRCLTVCLMSDTCQEVTQPLFHWWRKHIVVGSVGRNIVIGRRIILGSVSYPAMLAGGGIMQMQCTNSVSCWSGTINATELPRSIAFKRHDYVLPLTYVPHQCFCHWLLNSTKT